MTHLINVTAQLDGLDLIVRLVGTCSCVHACVLNSGVGEVVCLAHEIKAARPVKHASMR